MKAIKVTPELIQQLNEENNNDDVFFSVDIVDTDLESIDEDISHEPEINTARKI